MMILRLAVSWNELIVLELDTEEEQVYESITIIIKITIRIIRYILKGFPIFWCLDHSKPSAKGWRRFERVIFFLRKEFKMN